MEHKTRKMRHITIKHLKVNVRRIKPFKIVKSPVNYLKQ